LPQQAFAQSAARDRETAIVLVGSSLKDVDRVAQESLGSNPDDASDGNKSC
jgi:hypothetical protein